MLQLSLLICTLVVAVCGCARSSEPADQGRQQPFVFEERMGLATWHENRGCLAVFNASIMPRTRVVLVDQPASTEPPDRIGVPGVKEATVVERLSKACDERLSGSNNNGVASSFYHVATADDATPFTEMVFAILDPPSPVVVRDGHVEADLERDGVKELFRVCNSTENVHFMVWTGSSAEGRPRWHGTYYVGYDMVPSCTEQDVAGMVALERRR